MNISSSRLHDIAADIMLTICPVKHCFDTNYPVSFVMQFALITMHRSLVRPAKCAQCFSNMTSCKQSALFPHCPCCKINKTFIYNMCAVRSPAARIKHIHLYYTRPLPLDQVGSRSRRLWESPPTPTERYERRPCLCRIRCMCRSSAFLLFVKNGFVVGAR